MKPSLPRGTRDFGPEVAAKRSYIINTIKSNFIKYSFMQLETPAMENLSVLTGKYGDEGDQLLFKILNSGDFLSKADETDISKGSKHLTSKISSKGLRYDLTVPFARYVVMNRHELTFPFKRFQIQPVWRADNPQKGRYREFYQCDADIIGSRANWNEVELSLLVTDVFSDLGLQDYSLKINHREILFLLAKYVGLGENLVGFCVEVDKLDKIGQEKVSQSLIALGANEAKVQEIMTLFQETDRAVIISKIKEIDAENAGISEIVEYFDTLEDFKYKSPKVSLDVSLARGLTYYTGIVFEVKPTSVKMGSICGGGRYDDLTGIFGLKDVSGVGISFGLDRIYDVMDELNLFPENLTRATDVLITHFNKENLNHAQKMVTKLRDVGIKAELYPEVAKIKKQMNHANKIKAPYVILIGDDEMNNGKYSFKNMGTGTQQHLTITEIIDSLIA